MKIRVMGTEAECQAAREYYRGLEKESGVKSVSISGNYPNRGSNTIFRVYVDVEIRADAYAPLAEAHAVAQRVHDRVETRFPQVKHCMVHVNPEPGRTDLEEKT